LHRFLSACPPPPPPPSPPALLKQASPHLNEHLLKTKPRHTFSFMLISFRVFTLRLIFFLFLDFCSFHVFFDLGFNLISTLIITISHNIILTFPYWGISIITRKSPWRK